VGAIRGYRDLVVWREAMDLVVEVYRLSERLPDRERCGLTSQVQRAMVSVPANIAEGHGRSGTREYLHHLSVARGSLLEVETHLQIAVRLNYLPDDDVAPLLERTALLDRRLRALIARLRERAAN
jgi:four helix bundle protein